MSDLNPQLQAAITQQGLTPEQQAQLRMTVAQDPQLLAHLNDDAAKGYLHGFNLAAPYSPNLVGTYDDSTVTLPADSFGAGSANLAATLRTQHMLMEFSRASDPATGKQIPFGMVDNLQGVLNGSPALAEQTRQAVTLLASA